MTKNVLRPWRTVMHSAFHKEFFPTPAVLAFDLTKEYKGKVRSVLDPSAGKGDLLVPFERCNGDRWARAIQYLPYNGFEDVGVDLETNAVCCLPALD